MRLIISVVFIHLLSSFNLRAQSIELIEDYAEGQTESVIGQLFNFNNSIIYNGKNPFGDYAINRYDCEKNEIITVVKKEQLGWGKTQLMSVDNRLFILEKNDILCSRIYEATKSDLSDLILKYDAGKSSIGRIQSYKGNLLILEADKFAKTNIHVIDDQGILHTLQKGLIEIYSGFSYVRYNGHYIIVPMGRQLNSPSSIVFDLESKSIVDAEAVIPNFSSYAKVSRLYAINDESILFDSDSTYIYNNKFNRTYTLVKANWKLIAENKNYIFVGNKTSIFRIDKNDGSKFPMLPSLNDYRKIDGHIIGLDIDSLYLRIVVHNLDQNKTYYQETPLKSDLEYKLTDVAIVPKGIHLSIRYGREPKTRLYRVTQKEIKFIDTISMINSNYRIISANEDIYITYKNEIYGSELFHIDYPKQLKNTKFEDNNVSILPNPASEFIEIITSKINEMEEISILDSSGRIVISKCDFKNQDVSFLTSGVYHLLIKYNDGTTGTKKLIKQ